MTDAFGIPFQKNGYVTMLLAKEFLQYSNGDRIQTIDSYSEHFGVGRGTVQQALKYIQEEHVVTLDSRGHMGTYISEINHSALFKIAGIGNLSGVMPLPYSLRYEGLSTGFYSQMQELSIPFHLAFMRGSALRLRDVLDGRFDFAVVSKLAFDLAERKNELQIVLCLPDHSYVGNHALILRDKSKTQIENGMRVALDKSSIDQKYLTEQMTQDKDVTLVEMPYQQIMERMERDEIDAAVWNEDELREKNRDCSIIKIEDHVDDHIAVCVALKTNKVVENLFKLNVSAKDISEIQQAVLSKKMVPFY